MFKANGADIVLSDIGIPEADGNALMSWIRSLPEDEGGRVPAIAVTALARPEDVSRALSAGFNAHLAKPITPSGLVGVIAKLTRQKREQASTNLAA
jgi:CheY-like chemotaxis protein